MKKISVVTPCYNEVENIGALVEQIKGHFENSGYNYEHIIIDNASTDGTIGVLRKIAAENPQVKIILNSRNFGHIRSPFHGIRQASGDALIFMASDFQDPPSLIPELLKKWEEGFKVVKCIKNHSNESRWMFAVRKIYYAIVNKLADINLTNNFTGFGLYDKSVVDVLKTIEDPYPYFRGLISEIGFSFAEQPYTQPKRKRGITKNNFYTLYDIAMLGIISNSKVPLRLATMSGFIIAFFSLLVGFCYLVAKLAFWQRFQLGLAPIVVGVFFFISIQLIFIGILGEYIGFIHTIVLKRPLVVEQERINF